MPIPFDIVICLANVKDFILQQSFRWSSVNIQDYLTRYGSGTVSRTSWNQIFANAATSRTAPRPSVVSVWKSMTMKDYVLGSYLVKTGWGNGTLHMIVIRTLNRCSGRAHRSRCGLFVRLDYVIGFNYILVSYWGRESTCMTGKYSGYILWSSMHTLRKIRISGHVLTCDLVGDWRASVLQREVLSLSLGTQLTLS